tara:strand:- start:490 stop:1356 length:867 start_codon:yes stop_codon:yes gene_type:complete
MSKHTLSGTDFSNGARVNQTFEIDDENVKRPKNFKTLKDIKDFYGVGLDTPLQDFDGLTLNQLKKEFGHSELPEGTEFYQGGFLDPTKKGTVLDKNRPKNLLRPLASFADLILRDTTDFDKLGILGEGRYSDTSKTIDQDDLSKYLLPQGFQKKAENVLDTAFPKELPSKEEIRKESIDEELSRREVIDPLDRKKRREQAIETLVSNTVSMPIYTRLLEDAAKRRLELDKAMLGAREMMPSNIQNIMLSKQAQQQMASSAFAEEAKALAAQQDAATRFAGLGMERRFG